MSFFGDQIRDFALERVARRARDYAMVPVALAVMAAANAGALTAEQASLSVAGSAQAPVQIVTGEQQGDAAAVIEVIPAEAQEQQPAEQQAQAPTPSSVAQSTPQAVPSPAATPPPAPRPNPVPTQAPARPDTSSRSPRPAPAANLSVTERFIVEHAEAARVSMLETGVPASVTLAQAILESNSGQSLLSTKAKNFFGIKGRGKAGPAGVVYMDTWEHLEGQDVTRREPFRAYNNAAESFSDHGRYLRENARYAQAFKHTDDARQFARLIHKAGYATDPAYSDKLIRLMDRYDLYQYDQ